MKWLYLILIAGHAMYKIMITKTQLLDKCKGSVFTQAGRIHRTQAR